MTVLADTSWVKNGDGMARYASEILSRIPHIPLSDNHFSLHPSRYVTTPLKIMTTHPDVFFTPGFNPPLISAVPFVFTIADLIHLRFPEENTLAKTIFYGLLKRLASRAFKILTVSEYSKREILSWCSVSPDHVVVNGNGVGAEFTPEGKRHQPGFPYLLYVGNFKPHKNVPRLIAAFAKAGSVAPNLRLMLSGKEDPKLRQLASEAGLEDRVVFAGRIPESELPGYYRGATALVFPSLLEGFGLPAIEAMACGLPVVCSDRSSLPEVVGNSGILVDPESIESMAEGIGRVISEPETRIGMKSRGIERARLYTWDRSAAIARQVLAEAAQEKRR